MMLAGDIANAQDAVAAFYRGRQINLQIGSTVGGGYDAYARLLARYYGNDIPGKPSIIPQNMPGAASNKLAYYINTVAPKDGTAIGAIFAGAILDPLIGNKTQVNHDPSKLVYLGSANDDVFLCVARKDAAVQTFADLFSKELTVGASDDGGSTRDFPAMLNNLLGTKFRIVSGYAGMKEITLAIERGEVQGVCGLSWPSISTQHPEWFTGGLVNILAQEHASGHPDVNKLGVPLTLQFAKSAEDRQVMELVYSQETFGRPYVMPPGTPPERVAALRQAFLTTLRNPDLLAEAKQRRLDIAPMAGEELQAVVAKIYATPAAIVERAKQAQIYRPPAR
jgi:tripartite-type tricarboxylate transporter receptor subunit TctC